MHLIECSVSIWTVAMRGVSVLFCLAICTGWASAQFLNNKPFPTYSLEDMPSTEFTCRDKILGGYYADPQTQCQMFHICVKVAGVGIQDFRFLCPNGTAFDQDHQICADWEDVDCDATTLYYSSDNFDLYRIGSGLESKAVKYGEEEETFALQRAETGDTRLNHEHQSGSVNQQKEQTFRRNQQKKQPVHHNTNDDNNNNNDREIFKGASSSNFFNNRNNGKEKDEDYDDNVNVNQNRDNEQRRKVSRVNNQRRPQATRGTTTTSERSTTETQTTRPPRPSTFRNNFAGSYVPTTARPATNSDQYTTAVNTRGRNGQRRQQQYDDRQAENNPSSTTYSSSTPAPFRQTQQYNTSPNNRQSTQNNDNGQYYTTTHAPRRDTEVYTPSRQKQTTPYDDQYDTPKVKPTKPENYPTTPTKNYDQYDSSKKTTPYGKTENYPSNNPIYFDKKQTVSIKQTENYPTTTIPPKPKPFSASNQPSSNFPTTFAPRTNAGFTQIIQQTEQYNNRPSSNSQQYNIQKSTPQLSSTTSNQQYNSPSSTPKSTPYTQYTPTVPKISTTTPVSRSSRFDETEYDHDDDRSHTRDDKREDEFLKTAHSQNIAASRNELAKTTTRQQPSTLTTKSFESPRPFSASSNTPKSTTAPKESSTIRVTSAPRNTESSRSTHDVTRKPAEEAKKPLAEPKKTKDASYDYAYYDSNPTSEQEYDIDTELKKSTVQS